MTDDIGRMHSRRMDPGTDADFAVDRTTFAPLVQRVLHGDRKPPT